MNKIERAKEFQKKIDILLDDYSDVIYKEFIPQIKDVVVLLIKIIQLKQNDFLSRNI